MSNARRKKNDLCVTIATVTAACRDVVLGTFALGTCDISGSQPLTGHLSLPASIFYCLTYCVNVTVFKHCHATRLASLLAVVTAGTAIDTKTRPSPRCSAPLPLAGDERCRSSAVPLEPRVTDAVVKDFVRPRRSTD